ncbi:uncharacterized protein LOC124265083 [Haliotis rubra]|uniref:uncharacterized protein LOC124265083 n=1 Tax=Haliotis rubra TaxID=36100 RepID=UPI001EE50779|nr:uncharacterized protein LOC124265083 [Haliotis rubra]
MVAKLAELKARSQCLQQRHALEEEEQYLKQKKEKLEIETELVVANAQVEALEELEITDSASKINRKEQLNMFKSGKSIPPSVLRPTSQTCVPNVPQTQVFDDVPQNTENATMKMVIENQRLATLPERKVPVFRGDPLDFKTFIMAFEHCIESKTDSFKDRLYYLEQYTSGMPGELVRSCIHMEPEQGYTRAKQPLQTKFGNKFKVATAYTEKALQWPHIKAEDSDKLNRYSLYLLECYNSMADIEYLRELEEPKNMKIIISKLPYKMRDRWRSLVFTIQEKKDKKITFEDLVTFDEEQAQILADPLYGNIEDGRHNETR